MSGETSDISQFCEIAWFKWIMILHVEITQFPDDDFLKLGHYLGPSIDVCQAMTTMILTQNGQVLNRSTSRPLTPGDTSDKKWDRCPSSLHGQSP